jgi:hypothetical protein
MLRGVAHDGFTRARVTTRKLRDACVLVDDHGKRLTNEALAAFDEDT